VAAEKLVVARSSANIGPFAAWRDAKVGEPTDYLGCDGEIAAYCFPIEKNKASVGYVMVDASRIEMPIQEFSCSAPPHARANLEACKKAAKEAAGEIRELGNQRYAYLAPGLYAVEYPVLDKGRTAGSVFVDMTTSQVIASSAFAPKHDGTIHAAGAPEAWKAISDGATKVVLSRHESEFKYVTNVPLMIRRAGQNAVAWAEVLNYWGVRKPREIPELIAQQLSKSEVGNDSVRAFAKDRGFRLKLENKQRGADTPDTRATFTDVRMEVDSGRPFIVTATNKLVAGKSVSSTLAGAGYATDEMGKWLIVHTGISPTETIAQPDQSAPWCRPGVVFVNWDCAVDNFIVTKVQVDKEAQNVEK